MADDAAAPLISVIIPAWNAEGCIAKCLDAIGAQSFPRERFEVILIDNASTDRTSAIAGDYSFVTVLHEPEPGSYRSRNRGIAAARGEYLLFTDADCVPDPNWIAAAAERAASLPDVGVHAGRITLFREAGAGPFSAQYEELVAFDQQSNLAMGYCVTANWLCRRDMMTAIGGFNATMMSGGDVDCSKRVRAAGHTLEYAPELVVGHPTRANIMELIRKRRRIVGGRWQLESWHEAGLRWPFRRLLESAKNEARQVRRSDIAMLSKTGVLAIIGVLLLSGYYELLRLRSGKPAYRS